MSVNRRFNFKAEFAEHHHCNFAVDFNILDEQKFYAVEVNLRGLVDNFGLIDNFRLRDDFGLVNDFKGDVNDKFCADAFLRDNVNRAAHKFDDIFCYRGAEPGALNAADSRRALTFKGVENFLRELLRHADSRIFDA